MSRKCRYQKRSIPTDPVYDSRLVSMFIHRILKRGKKSLAQRIFYQAMETIEWFGSVMHLLCLYLMRNTLTPSQGAILAGALGISGGLLINFTVEETLREEDRREVEYESLGNPISAISFFKKNEQMTKLGLLHVIVTVPYYNTTLGMYRRQRFGWTMKLVYFT